MASSGAPPRSRWWVLDVGGGTEERRDVGEHGEEAPAPEIVEAELLAAGFALTAHDEAQVALRETLGGLGYF
jgi:hypothetical protein